MISRLVLGDCLAALIDHRGKTPRKLGSVFSDSGVPVASAVLVKNGRLDLSETRYVDNETFRRWMPVPVQRGDVILTSEAPMGRVARVRTDEPLVLGQRVYGLRGRPGVLDSGYLYYALQTGPVQADLVGRSTGTTVTGIRQSALRSVVIPALPFAEQEAVAEVLSALDDKIICNEHTVSVAAALGRALLEDGQSGSPHRLGDAVKEMIRGSAPRYADSGGLVVLNQKCVRGHRVDLRPGRVSARLPSSERLLSRDDVLVNSTGYGTLGRVARWTRQDIEATVDAHITIVRFDADKVDPICAGIALTSVERSIEQLAEGSTGQTELKRDRLAGLEIRLPSPETQRKLRGALRSIDELSLARHAENEWLSTIRNELLPLLISRKICVKDAEKAVEEVL